MNRDNSPVRTLSDQVGEPRAEHWRHKRPQGWRTPLDTVARRATWVSSAACHSFFLAAQVPERSWALEEAAL